MESSENTPVVLSYSKATSIRDHRIVRWLTTRPHWLIALILLAPVWAFDAVCLDSALAPRNYRLVEEITRFLFFVALFIPGALRRVSGRDYLVMLGFAGACYGAHAALKHWPPGLPFPYSLVFWAAMPAVMVGVGEWLLVCPRSRRSLVWMMVMAAAVACLVPLIGKTLDFVGGSVSIPSVGGGHHIRTWEGVLWWPLRTVLIWVAVPAALALGQQATLRRRIAGGAVVVASAAAFILFFHVVMYQMARWSLRGGGVFCRSSSASILGTRGSQADLQAVWRALEQADWSQPEAQDFWRADYRKACIEVVVERDHARGAQRLAEMLRAKPSGLLARYCAKLLGEERRVEAAPVLMRYALHHNSECTEALEAMRVPQAALAIIMEVSMYDRPAPLTADFRISTRYRDRLVRLLGKDVGPNLSKWTSYYDSVVDQLPSPLSSDEAAEMDRVMQAMSSYWDASDRLYRGKCRLFTSRLEQDGKGEYLEQLVALEPLLRGQRRLTNADATGLDPAIVNVMDGYWQKALSDLTVSPPDWDAPGTAGLEGEVAAYTKRVDAIIAKYGVAVDRPPGTSPARR